MTDKEIIIDTLNFIKLKNGHTDIKEHWIGLNEETQIRVKLKLEDNDFATPHIYDAWSLMITSIGLKIKPNDLKEDGNLIWRKKFFSDKKYIINTSFVIIGLLFSGVSTYITYIESNKQVDLQKQVKKIEMQQVEDSLRLTKFLKDYRLKK